MAALPVLFVHAFPLDARMWRAQLDALAGTRTLLAPDLRGFGSNRSGTLPTSLEQHARDLVELLDRSGVPRAIVVGLSMGGYIAFALHRIAPSRIAALMLCDTKAAADDEAVRKARTARVERVEREGVELLPDEMIPGLVGPACPASVRLAVRRYILEQDAGGVAAALRAIRDRADSTPVLGGIRVPVSLVCGEHDTLTPPDVMRPMASAIAHATFTLLEGAGHLSNLEAPAAFGRALLELLARADEEQG
jgi:pimeloyl-ACP methyl ester carboxylesterase